MCGRYSQTLELSGVVARFSLKPPPFNCKPCYNIAPGALRPVACQGGLKLLKWGFVPAWAASAPVENGLVREGFINARSESIASRPVFRNAFYKTRCLVPADGFYEWHSAAGAKIPYRFELRDKSLFAMAGVYEEATGTYAVITAAANALVRAIHHRMPVILERSHEALWLDPKMRDTETLLPLLRGYESSLMHGYRVSDVVNDPKNDSPDCLKAAQL